jgi:phage baseplate assembly protein W
LQSEGIEAVTVALRDYEPRIKVDAVLVTVENDEATLLAVKINYTIRQTDSRHNHVYPFALTEGTQLALNDGGL